MKTKDGFEITRGAIVYNNWGEPRKISLISSFDSNKHAWHTNMDGRDIQGYTENGLWPLYYSQKTALENHLKHITRKAWELEKEAREWRERESKARLQIIEL